MQMLDPSSVRLGGGGSGGPYMKGPGDKLSTSGFQNSKPGSTGSPIVGAETVRATGTGPFDAAYRQNLATYAGGFSQRPGGNLSFNPTGSLFGNPTGGGTAPVMGGPTDLLTAAMGGQGYSANTDPQAPQAQPGASTGKARSPLSFWLDQYNSRGNPLRTAY